MKGCESIIFKDKNKITSALKYVLFLTFFLIFSIILINYIVITEMSIPVANDNDWIGFYGSILSGIFTLIGIFITIKYYRDKDQIELYRAEEKKRLQMLPYFKIANIDDWRVDVPIENNIYFYAYEKAEIMNTAICLFKLENIGLGSAINIEFTNMNLFERDPMQPLMSYRPGDSDLYFLHADFGDIKIGNSTFLTIKYEDLLSNKYEQTFGLRYSLDNEKGRHKLWFNSSLKQELK